jgi:hypothetical protein
MELPADVTASSGIGSKGYGILNPPEKKLYVVLDEKKQVVVFDLDKAAE